MGVKRLLFRGALVGLCALALALGEARAGTLEVIISEGGTSYDILDQGPFDLNGALNKIASNTATGGLVFPDFNIVGLSASTNNPGAPNPDGAVLSMSGEIQRTTTGAAATLTIVVTDTDYMVPSGKGLLMTSAASDSYSNVPGIHHDFTSYINPSNTPGATEIGAATLQSFTLSGTNSNKGTVTLGGLTAFAPYGLTSVTTLTVSAPAGSTLPDVTFTGQTQVTSAIPEPASVALMGTGIALVLFVRFRRGLKLG